MRAAMRGWELLFKAVAMRVAYLLDAAMMCMRRRGDVMVDVVLLEHFGELHRHCARTISNDIS